MRHVLLILDPRVPSLEIKEFRDSQRAMRGYARVEREHAGDHRMEIVLVGSDSLETAKVTHGHCFNVAAGAVDAAGLAAS